MRHLILMCFLLTGVGGCEHFEPAAETGSITPQMQRAQVLAILGAPAEIHRQDDLEAWEYCRVGYITDDYLVVWLRDGRVVATERQAEWEFGHCKPQLGGFDWNNAPA